MLYLTKFVALHANEIMVIFLIITLGMIAMLVMTCKKNARLSSVAFFDPLTKWGNKRLLNEVFLPQLLLESYIETEGTDKDEAVHFIEARIAKIESLKKVEQDILVRLLTANIKKYLLHPMDQCFRIGNGVFRIIITRKKVSREDSNQFLRNIQTAMDDLILIYPTLESIVSANMLSWTELAEGTLNETASMTFDVVEDEEYAKKEATSTSVWVPSVLKNVLNKNGQQMYPQLES